MSDTPQAGIVDTSAYRTVRVWDLPTRLFHWALAVLVLVSIFTGQIGGNAMVWHFRSGYAILALLAFRLVWGLVGGHWSRFGSFIYRPGAYVRYLRGHPRPNDHFDVGHSPLGSLSVFALLVLLIVQVGTGLVADDEIANAGPLARYVSESTSFSLTGYHQHWGQWALIALIALHLSAIVFYEVVRKRRLVGPMVHGDKPLPEGAPAAKDTWGTRGLAALVLAACAALVWWIVSPGD